MFRNCFHSFITCRASLTFQWCTIPDVKPPYASFWESFSLSVFLSLPLSLSPFPLSLTHAEKPLCKITVQFWKVETGRQAASATMECWPWWWLLSNGGSTIGFSETKGLLSGLTGGNAHIYEVKTKILQLLFREWWRMVLQMIGICIF